MSESPIRLFLVDDHASFRSAVSYMLGREPDLVVVGESGSLAEARTWLLAVDRPVDVMLTKMHLPDGSGLELAMDLHAHHPSAHLAVLTGSKDRRDHARAIAAGAAGVIHKSASLSDIATSVRRLYKHEPLIPHHETTNLLRFARQLEAESLRGKNALSKLTPRETEILQALANGKSDKDIALEFKIANRTVATHMASVLDKLGVQSRLQAVLLALKNGIVELK